MRNHTPWLLVAAGSLLLAVVVLYLLDLRAGCP